MVVIFDNNVLVSAVILKESLPRKSWDIARKKDQIISSKAIMAELHRIILRPKFDKYISLEPRLEFIFEVEASSKILSVSHSLNVCRDPKDNKYLELAISGHADNDLLVLHPFEHVSIITPHSGLSEQYLTAFATSF